MHTEAEAAAEEALEADHLDGTGFGRRVKKSGDFWSEGSAEREEACVRGN